MAQREDYTPVKQWYKKGGKWIQTNSNAIKARINKDPRSALTRARMMPQEIMQKAQPAQTQKPKEAPKQAARHKKGLLNSLNLEDLLKVLILLFLAIIIKDLTS